MHVRASEVSSSHGRKSGTASPAFEAFHGAICSHPPRAVLARGPSERHPGTWFSEKLFGELLVLRAVEHVKLVETERCDTNESKAHDVVAPGAAKTKEQQPQQQQVCFRKQEKTSELIL
mmetsp:Transcript_7691/g.16423  ORF Transcript_7691/g.16423 Transcript_7691/m.16423 type:complete len:119 (-) Transcript_7691:415-771(-)